MLQLVSVIFIIIISICYIAYRTYMAIHEAKSGCYGCKGCALKEQMIKTARKTNTRVRLFTLRNAAISGESTRKHEDFKKKH